MNNIDIKHVMRVLAEDLVVGRHNKLPPYDDPYDRRSLRNGCYGIYFQISVDYENFGYEKDGHTHHREWERRYQRTVHIIVTERHNVFHAVTDKLIRTPKLGDWINANNHDACWQEGLSVIDGVLFEGYSECFEFLPKEHKRSPAETEPFVQFNNWHFGHSPFAIVKVEGEREIQQEDRWTLSFLEELKFGIRILGRGTGR